MDFNNPILTQDGYAMLLRVTNGLPIHPTLDEIKPVFERLYLGNGRFEALCLLFGRHLSPGEALNFTFTGEGIQGTWDLCLAIIDLLPEQWCPPPCRKQVPEWVNERVAVQSIAMGADDEICYDIFGHRSFVVRTKEGVDHGMPLAYWCQVSENKAPPSRKGGALCSDDIIRYES